MPRSTRRRFLAALFAGALGMGLGAACDKGETTTSSPQGANCPASKPRQGKKCPRGESAFCVYRTTGGDYACTCGGGKWGCGKK